MANIRPDHQDREHGERIPKRHLVWKGMELIGFQFSEGDSFQPGFVVRVKIRLCIYHSTFNYLEGSK